MCPLCFKLTQTQYENTNYCISSGVSKFSDRSISLDHVKFLMPIKIFYLVSRKDNRL